MALVTTPKAGSANSNTPSKVIERQSVQVSKQTPSSARAEALKARIAGKVAAPVAQPVAPRPTGSSARREQVASLKQFKTPATAQTAPTPGLTPKTSARAAVEGLESIEPPPSGLAPGQEPVIQEPTDTETPAPAVEATNEQLSPQFVALARKERQLRKAQQELKAAQDAWKQDQGKYVSRDNLTSDTLKVLAEAGITPDKLVELQLNQATPPTPEQELKSEIAKLKAQLNELVDPENGTLAQRDKQAYEQAVSQIRSDAQLLVESNPAYETIRSEGQSEEVVKLITSVFDAEGVILDVEEAARLVEDKLVERISKQYERITRLTKFKAKFGQSAEPAEVTPAQQTPSQPKPTLTNAGTSTRPLSARDKAILRVQEALDRKKGR
jgi:hypothetical protein